MSGAAGGFASGTLTVPRGATVTLVAGKGGQRNGMGGDPRGMGQRDGTPVEAGSGGRCGGGGNGNWSGADGGGGSFALFGMPGEDPTLYLAAGGGGGSAVNASAGKFGFGGPGGGERGYGSCGPQGANEAAQKGGGPDGPGQPVDAGLGAAGAAECFRMDRTGNARGGSGGQGCAGGPTHGGAGGGGGYYGGAGGGLHNQQSKHSGGGGGSGYTHAEVRGATMVRGGFGEANDGTSMPPQTDHPHYKDPAGQCAGIADGHDGLVVAVEVETGRVLGVAEKGGLASKVSFSVE